MRPFLYITDTTINVNNATSVAGGTIIINRLAVLASAVVLWIYLTRKILTEYYCENTRRNMYVDYIHTVSTFADYCLQKWLLITVSIIFATSFNIDFGVFSKVDNIKQLLPYTKLLSLLTLIIAQSAFYTFLLGSYELLRKNAYYFTSIWNGALYNFIVFAMLLFVPKDYVFGNIVSVGSIYLMYSWLYYKKAPLLLINIINTASLVIAYCIKSYAMN